MTSATIGSSARVSCTGASPARIETTSPSTAEAVCGAARARPRHRHLGDRRRLDHDRVEGALDRRQRVAAVEEAGEDADADPAVAPLGDAEQLQREAELLGVGEVVGLDRLDPLVGDLVEADRGVEGEPGEDRHLRRGVGAVDVLGRVGLGVAELLGLGRAPPRRRRRGRGHLAEDEVGGAVDDPEDASRSRSTPKLSWIVRTTGITAADRRLEAQLHAGLAGDREELVAVLGEQLLVGGDDRAAGAQRREHVLAGRVGAAHQLDDQVGALEDLVEVALAAGEHAGQLGPAPGRGLDRVGALVEQLGEGGADGAAAEQADADGFRTRCSPPTQTSRAVRSS